MENLSPFAESENKYPPNSLMNDEQAYALKSDTEMENLSPFTERENK